MSSASYDINKLLFGHGFILSVIPSLSLSLSQGYDGDTSSSGTLKSFSTRFGGSTNSLDSAGKESFVSGARLTKRQSMILEGATTDGPSEYS